MAERLSTESNSEFHHLRDRVAKVEWKADAIDNRLSQGAEAFGDLRSSIKEVRNDIKEAHEKFREATKPKPIPIWRVVSSAFGLIVFAGTLIWYVARYPDRAEFKGLDDELDLVKYKQHEMAADQKLIKDSVSRQEKSQEKMDAKLDRLLMPRLPRSKKR